MPVNVVKNKRDEGLWERAKALAHKNYPNLEEGDKFFSIVMTIYKNLKGGKK